MLPTVGRPHTYILCTYVVGTQLQIHCSKCENAAVPVHLPYKYMHAYVYACMYSSQ
jgi:hypothetical protein